MDNLDKVKLRKWIKHANEALADAKGNIVFVGESNESVLEINHDVRFIDISEYPLDSSNELAAFIQGLMGGNYDIETIYLDGLLNLYIMTPEEICDWLKKLEKISERREVNLKLVLVWMVKYLNASNLTCNTKNPFIL